MITVQELAHRLIGNDVTVDSRTSRESYVGRLAAIDYAPVENGLGPSVALVDDEDNTVIVFDVTAIASGVDDSDDEDMESDEFEEEVEEEGGFLN